MSAEYEEFLNELFKFGYYNCPYVPNEEAEMLELGQELLLDAQK